MAAVVPRSRVRSGCITCRKRKVKCGEEKPTCRNVRRSKAGDQGGLQFDQCDRLSRICRYNEDEGQGSHAGITALPGHGPQTPRIFEDTFPALRLDGDLFVSSGLQHTEPASTDSSDQQILSPSIGVSHDSFRDAIDVFTPGILFGTLGLELPATPAVTDRALCAYFLEEIDLPLIAPFDGQNWIRIKRYIVEIGTGNIAITSAISALETLHEVERGGLDKTIAFTLYHEAKANHSKMLSDDDQGLEKIFTATFLLVCFEIVAQQEQVSILTKSDDTFVRKLEQWAQLRPWPPVIRRLEAWLQLFHWNTLRLGGSGILSRKVNSLLSADLSNASVVFLDPTPDTASVLYDTLSNTLFEFYIRIQEIGAQFCGHHHLLNGSVADEGEADRMASKVRKQISFLHQQRPSILRLTRDDLSGQLPDSILNRLSTLIDLCNATFFTQIVDLGRAHSHSPTPSPEALEAMIQVRRIVDNNVMKSKGSVNPGFIWPIFIYALQADEEGGEWAVRMLRQVRNAVLRSDLIAQLLNDLLEEQRKKGELVDCMLFCVERYGVPPPFM